MVKSLSSSTCEQHRSEVGAQHFFECYLHLSKSRLTMPRLHLPTFNSPGGSQASFASLAVLSTSEQCLSHACKPRSRPALTCNKQQPSQSKPTALLPLFKSLYLVMGVQTSAFLFPPIASPACRAQATLTGHDAFGQLRRRILSSLWKDLDTERLDLL